MKRKLATIGAAFAVSALALAGCSSGSPEAEDGIAQAIRVIFLTYDPDLVILGGGLRRLGGPLFDRIAAGAVGAALMSRS